MIQRSVCLCDGKYIGIESIYTVIDGKQINIPNKLEALRQKGRNNELFCPCGCGANLTVVASERGLRAQHFRIKDGTEKVECRATEEGEESLYSKIVLKCWLDDKLQVDDIETRVPISMLSDSERKYEFSFVSPSRKVAVSYTYDRYNLSEEKFCILQENRGTLNLICITDHAHRNPTGQYPETLMRMQEQQGYCSFLKQVGGKYKEALLSVVVYRKDCDGVWQEIQVAYALLHEFSFSADGELQYEDSLVSPMVMATIAAFDERMQAELSRREAERLEQEQEAERKEKERIARIEKARKRQQEAQEKRRLEEEAARRREEEFQHNLPQLLETSQEPIEDAKGRRLYKCERCGRIAQKNLFEIMGIADKPNMGICKPCVQQASDAQRKADVQALIDSIKKEGLPKKETNQPRRCPLCGGGVLQEKTGRYGRFIGCSNYPACKYAESYIYR